MVYINIFVWITAIVAIASLVAAVTPTPKGDKFLGKLYKVIDFLALNIGKAKDKQMARKTTIEVAADLDKHEAICAERWLETISRIKRLELFVIATLVTLLLSAGAILAEQVF